MNSICFVCDSGEQITISGIDEGDDQGRIEICWEGRRVVLVSLVIERLCPHSFHDTLVQNVEKISRVASCPLSEGASRDHIVVNSERSVHSDTSKPLDSSDRRLPQDSANIGLPTVVESRELSRSRSERTFRDLAIVPVGPQPSLGRPARRALRVIPPLPQPLVEGNPESQWVVFHMLPEPLVVDRVSLLHSLKKESCCADYPRFMAMITALFQPLTYRPLPSVFSMIRPCELLRALQAEIADVVEASTLIEKRDEYRVRLYAQAEQTVEWIDKELQGFIKRSSWTAQNWIKVQGVGLPIRCVRDSQTGEVAVEITVGVFEGGADKDIKSVIRLDRGKINILVQISPRRSSPSGYVYSDQEKGEMLHRLQREVLISEELLRGGVPNIMGFLQLPYEKEGRVKYRYMMTRCAETLAEYEEKVMLEDPFEHGRLSSRHLSDILILHLQIIDSLRHMHRLRWVHRDIKPQNILVHQGKAFLIDFGFSQQTGEKGNFVGAPGYIAPELLYSLDEQNVTTASDIWSFGIMLYYITQPTTYSLEEDQRALAEKIQSFHAEMAILAKQKEEELAALGCQRDGEMKEGICHQYSDQVEKARQAWMEKMHPLLVVLEARIEEIRETLNDKTDPLKMLLRDLLSLHPAERGVAQEAFDRLHEIIECK